MIVHDARMHADMKRMLMTHHTFHFDGVFGGSASNDQVYAGTARDLVLAAAAGAGCTATVMMYGQTGSGKTFSMSAIYERATQDLFTALTADAQRGGAPVVTISFVELAGDSCLDMLNGGQSAQLLIGRDGAVQPFPVAEIPVQDADELLRVIRFACSLRATEATGVHDASSRSHAVCRIYISRGGEGGGGTAGESMLQLVDLAGSEHRIDSADHDAARRKEGAQINASLSALKECVRSRARGEAFVPYRKSKLTHLLRACFAEGNPTVVLATVSPSSKDTEHSINTLRHGQFLATATSPLKLPHHPRACPTPGEES
jgi:kinesin family protein 2/24